MTSITLTWTGSTVGFSEVKRARTAEAHIYSRFWYLPRQPWGDHTVTVRLKRLPKGQRWIVGQFLVVGSFASGK